MASVRRCPRCATLTMLSGCPTCRTPTTVCFSPDLDSLSYQEEPPLHIRYGGAGGSQSAKHPDASGYSKDLPATEDATDGRPSKHRPDTEKSAEELLAELRKSREHRDRLIDHLESLAKANVELSEKLQRAKEQMLMSASDVRDLHDANKRIRARQTQGAGRQLADRDSSLPMEDDGTEDLLQIPARLSAKGPGAQGRSSQPRHSFSNETVSSVSDITAESPTNRNRGRPAGGAAATASGLPARRRGEPVDVTPISIAVESAGPANSLRRDDDDKAEIARLRRLLRERDATIRRIQDRAECAEAVVRELVDGLDGARELANEGNRILAHDSPYGAAASIDYDAGVVGAPSGQMQSTYEAMLARQGLAPHSRQYVGAAAVSGFNNRVLPSRYPASTESAHAVTSPTGADGPFQQANRTESLVN